MIKRLKVDLRKIANPEKAKILQRFFKTGKGDYGEGDLFLGVTVPESRKIAIEFKALSLEEISRLLKSKIHEERLIALLILVYNFQRDEKKRDEIYSFYIKNKININNWDLVDLSADKIVGAHLFKKDKSILYELAVSENFWDRRIAIISTFYFIKNNKFDDTLKIAKILLNDKHDLIQKAVGWMLREIGKRDIKKLEKYLKENYKFMPRTMLRYSIEKFDEAKRKKYLQNKI